MMNQEKPEPISLVTGKTMLICFGTAIAIAIAAMVFPSIFALGIVYPVIWYLGRKQEFIAYERRLQLAAVYCGCAAIVVNLFTGCNFWLSLVSNMVACALWYISTRNVRFRVEEDDSIVLVNGDKKLFTLPWKDN